MRAIASVLFVAALALGTGSAFAHHPGHDLDNVMGSKEKYFQAIEKQTPLFTLQDADGRSVSLDDLRGKVVVLHFIYAHCPDVCPLHAERIAEIQRMVNQSPMKERVRFLTITTDPSRDTAEVLKGYGPAHGLDALNWTFLTTKPDQPEDTTRKLAQAFGHTFTKAPDGYQTHGIVTHVIDKQGQWRANFHGLKFEPINLVLYINALTNEQPGSAQPSERGLWARLKGLFQ